MNIFYLDEDVEKNAQYHVDKHVVKMITELAQLMSSAFYFTDLPYLAPYKLSHANHPCAIWVRESLYNWKWCKKFGLALYAEYKYRYNNRTHLAGETIKNMLIPNLIDRGPTPRPQAMPMHYKNVDTVTAYRNYYIGEKRHLISYTRREIPQWLIDGIKEYNK